MNVLEKEKFWSKVTKLPLKQFNLSQIKKSNTKNIHYRGHGHGTCTVVVHNRDISEYVLQGLKYIASIA